MSWSLEQIVDLDRYPILELDSPSGQALVESCRQRFADDVLCELPGFVRPAAVTSVVDKVDSLQNQAHLMNVHRGAYTAYAPIHGDVPEPIAPDSPHGRSHLRRVHYLAFDEFEPESVIPVLYKNQNFIAFVSRVLRVPVLYPTGDPLMAAPVSLHQPGCELGWHCDTQEYTVSVLFRASEEGGLFQYVPLAAPGDDNFKVIPDVFDGDHELIRDVPIGEGSIVIFRGANTLHRVTRTARGPCRILSPFHYEQSPGRIYNDEFKMNSFGRTDPRQISADTNH